MSIVQTGPVDFDLDATLGKCSVGFNFDQAEAVGVAAECLILDNTGTIVKVGGVATPSRRFLSRFVLFESGSPVATAGGPPVNYEEHFSVLLSNAPVFPIATAAVFVLTFPRGTFETVSGAAVDIVNNAVRSDDEGFVMFSHDMSTNIQGDSHLAYLSCCLYRTADEPRAWHLRVVDLPCPDDCMSLADLSDFIYEHVFLSCVTRGEPPAPRLEWDRMSSTDPIQLDGTALSRDDEEQCNIVRLRGIGNEDMMRMTFDWTETEKKNRQPVHVFTVDWEGRIFGEHGKEVSVTAVGMQKNQMVRKVEGKKKPYIRVSPAKKGSDGRDSRTVEVHIDLSEIPACLAGFVVQLQYLFYNGTFHFFVSDSCAVRETGICAHHFLFFRTPSAALGRPGREAVYSWWMKMFPRTWVGARQWPALMRGSEMHNLVLLENQYQRLALSTASEEASGTIPRTCYIFKCRGEALDRKDGLFGKSDPFFTLWYRPVKDIDWDPTLSCPKMCPFACPSAGSQVERQTLNPSWRPVRSFLGREGGNTDISPLDEDYTVFVYDHDDGLKDDDYIGSFRFRLGDVVGAQGVVYTLLNEHKRGRCKTSGRFVFDEVWTEEDPCSPKDAFSFRAAEYNQDLERRRWLPESLWTK